MGHASLRLCACAVRPRLLTGEQEKTHAAECSGIEGDGENWLFSWRQPGVSGGGDFEALTGPAMISRGPEVRAEPGPGATVSGG